MQLIGLAVALSLTLASVAAEAQQAGKVYRLGYLSEGSAAALVQPGIGLNGLRQGLRDLGWTEGVNLVTERYLVVRRVSSLAL